MSLHQLTGWMGNLFTICLVSLQNFPAYYNRCFPIYATVWQATNVRPNGNTTGVWFLSYPAQIQSRLAELRDFVHTQLTQAAHSQKLHYDQHTKQPTFVAGKAVWLSIPTAGKLDPRWEGEWVIKSMKSPVTAKIYDGRCTTQIVYGIVLFQAIMKQLYPAMLSTQMNLQIGLPVSGTCHSTSS